MPAAQGVQALARGDEYSPTPQLVHEADPVALHVPAAQSVHDALARLLNVPAGQFSGADMPVADAYVPFVASVQVVDPFLLW